MIDNTKNKAGFELAIFIFSIMAIFSMTFGVWLITDRESPVMLIKEPLVIAVILGTLFLLNGWKLSVFFTNTLQLVGQTSIPLMLLTLGVTIAKLQITAISKLLLPSILKFTVCLLFHFKTFFSLMLVKSRFPFFKSLLEI